MKTNHQNDLQLIVLKWIDKRINDMLIAPRMWGSDEAIEMQVLLLLEFRLLTLCPNFEQGDPSLLIDEYAEYLTKKFPKHPHQPLYQIVDSDPLGNNIAEELKKVVQVFTEKMNQECQRNIAHNTYERVNALRLRGWVIAVHNDYKLNGELHTFWLFTNGDRCARGEGLTDDEALHQVEVQINLIEK